MRLPRLPALAAIAAALLMGGCATNPMTGRSQFIMVSEQAAIAQSASAYQDMIGSLEKSGKINEDHALNERIRGISDRLIAQAVRYRPETKDWAWSIKVIEEPKTVNAFCMPGGRMAIYTGLIEKLEPSDDEIAQVMGHEISHALANHGAEKMSVQIASSVAVIAVTAAANRNDRSRQGVHTAAELAALAFINLPNSRTAEEEADKLGIELAARAGYQPHAAVTLWQKMMKESGNDGRFDFLSTHPAPPKRIESLAALEAPMLKLYDPQARHRPVAVAWTSRSVNEKNVDAPPAAGKLAADRPPPSDKAPLAFYSAAFDRFSQGNAELACDGCAAEFALRQGGLRERYAKQEWRQLALDAVDIGYGIDLAWFYLGKAAAALGHPEAAQRYFRRAVAAAGDDGTACAKALLIGCDGIDVAREAAAALRP